MTTPSADAYRVYETQIKTMTTEELDECVIDLKCQEASDINNAGREAQVKYILPGPALRKLIEAACEAQDAFELNELEAHADKLRAEGKLP